MKKGRIAILLLLGIMLVSGFACTGDGESTLTPTATPSSIRIESTCVRVIDGDTIEVLINGETYKVRYIGIDTPEMNDPRPDILALAEEATLVNKNLVDGKVVELEMALRKSRTDWASITLSSTNSALNAMARQ